jgi:hypothetical protein
MNELHGQMAQTDRHKSTDTGKNIDKDADTKTLEIERESHKNRNKQTSI